MAVYLAAFRDYSEYLAPGESGVVMLIAADRRQARVLLRYIRAFFSRIDLLKQLVAKETRESIELTNGIAIEIHTASFRSTRGYSLAACICDEIAFWRSDESANPDTEILNAIRPGMSTIPGALLLCISSAYSRRGELWRAFDKYHGEEDDSVLVWQASTQDMNPTISDRVIKDAYERDPASAAAEYGGEFRKDVEGYISIEVVDSVIEPGRHELPPSNFSYYGFVDPSGGSRDSMTLGIAHGFGDDKKVLDALREVRPPFSPESVVGEFCELLHGYGIDRAVGDRYAGTWVREQFQKHGIEYEPSPLTKSEIYSELLPLLNSGKVELLDHQRLKTQLVQLERRTSRGGKDSIDHSPHGSDDVVNAAAGALVLCPRQYQSAADATGIFL